MGNYVFRTDVLRAAVTEDAADSSSRHDLGGNIIPMLVKSGQANVYDFSQNVTPGPQGREPTYWRDVGTLDAFYEAHMDLISTEPAFNLYNNEWPIYSQLDPIPPARFLSGPDGRTGSAVESMVSAGAQVAGSVKHSVLSPGVVVGQDAQVEDSVLMDGVRVGKGAVVRNAIIDKAVVVPDGYEIGVHAERDKELFTVTASGVTVLGKKTVIEP
jgi:glucose-1-phosphate adenylyltransferase